MNERRGLGACAPLRAKVFLCCRYSVWVSLSVIVDSEVQAKRAKMVYQDLDPLILTFEVMSSRVVPEEHISVVYQLKCFRLLLTGRKI